MKGFSNGGSKLRMPHITWRKVMSAKDKKLAGNLLDVLGARGRSKRDKNNRTAHAPSQRPVSEDLTETMPDVETYIDNLGEKEFNERFETMLADMNLSEKLKEPIRQKDLACKKDMLIMNLKGNNVSKKKKLDSPVDYITMLKNTDISPGKLFPCLESLRIALTNNPVSWVQEFGIDGLDRVLHILSSCHNKDNKYDKVQHECIKCVRAIMNNTVGLKQIFDHHEAMTIIARSIDSNLPAIMIDAVKLMAAVSLVPPNGHEKALEAITIVGEEANRERFWPIIQGLKAKGNNLLRLTCIQLINAIVSTPEDLDFRIHLRNEFMRTGLIDVLEDLQSEEESSQIKEISIQLKVFQDHKEEDMDEFTQRYDNIRFDFDDITECYELLKMTTIDTSAEPYFLSILQHLLCIRDDMTVKPAYYKLIEECVSQIVLHRSGCDPDFRHTKRFKVDVEPLIETVVEKSKQEEERVAGELTKKLEEALTARAEYEAELAQAKSRIEELETKGFQVGNQSSSLNFPNSGSVIPPPPPPPMFGGIPPPPPPPMPGMGGIPPPPPPPPPPGSMPPPPPPPPPMGGGPPPMMNGIRGPPPPFGGFGPTPPALENLPFGMKPKKKYALDTPLKRANWDKIVPQKLTEKAFWVNVNEDKLGSEEIFDALSSRFSSAPKVKKNKEQTEEKKPAKKLKELKVLDSRSAQNLLILLGSIKMSTEEIRDCILRVDEEHLTESLIQQLLRYMPESDQLKKLETFKDQFSQLAEAEQFAITVGSIKRLVPRLNSILFKLKAKEMVQDLKPPIFAATLACEEIKKSKKFSLILELVLLIGNYMNSGSRNSQAVGFDIKFLTKLSSTKALDNKSTLLHFLAMTVESKHPDSLTFSEDLIHVDKAAKVSLENIEKQLFQMKKCITQLETDLKTYRPQAEIDRYQELMSSFLSDITTQYEKLGNMSKKVVVLYEDLSVFFVFDPKKYTLDEFFGDIKIFKDCFMEAHKENIKNREMEEKIRRAKESKEKAEREKQERLAKQRQLVDISAGGDQEGVMDSLLEAITTGSAFCHKPRKKATRVAGAERRAQLNRTRSRNNILSPVQSTTREIQAI